MRRSRLIENRVELEKVQRDLKLAREIQQSTFPSECPPLDGYDCAGYSEPAEDTGGDTWDAVPTDTGAVFLLGDATGHGVGPAISVTQVRSMLRMALLLGTDLKPLVDHLNRQLGMDMPPSRFITAWFGMLDATTHELHSIATGQGPLIHLHANDEVDILSADAPPLGIMPDLMLDDPIRRHLESGDMFFVASDGFAEAGLVDTITHSLNVDIDYSLFSDPTTQFYSNFLADLIDVLTCNAQLYLGDASVTSASFTINSVTADRSGYTDISVTFSAPIGALTSSYRSQARENLQVFFSNCASVSVMNLQAYDWSTNSISISCEEGTVIIPLDPYNAFALPDIQVKEGSLGYATADTRESTAGRCQGGPERFGVILNRTSGTTGCGMWERPVGTILNKPISSTGFAEFYMGGSDTCSGEVGFDFATPIYKAIANPAASIETLMKNPSLYKSGPGATVWYRLSDADGRSQVQLSGLTVSMTLNLNGATTKGECETPSSVTGAGVCRVEAVSEWFSTTNEQVGQATISYQYDSVTYGTSLTQQFTLKKHYEHDAVSEPTIILEAPKYPVFEGEENVVETD